VATKKSLLSRLVGTKEESDCCAVTIVSDEADGKAAATSFQQERPDAPEASSDDDVRQSPQRR
jgi:hypothetical protein